MVPAIVSQFIFDYLVARGPAVRDLVDPWADDSGLVELAAQRLVGVRGVGLTRGPAPRSSGADTVWTQVSDSLSHFSARSARYDVVLGVPPWGWNPKAVELELPNGRVHIADDPENMAIVCACAQLRRVGVCLLVVAPGFVARPGPDTAFPVLQRLGIGLEALVTLPRGAFRPDTGSGRFLIALAPTVSQPPAVAVMASDGTGCEALLASLHARSEQLV